MRYGCYRSRLNENRPEAVKIDDVIVAHADLVASRPDFTLRNTEFCPARDS